MSVSTRKQPVSTTSGLRDRVAQSGAVSSLASKATPLAQQAGPLARNAGTSVQRSANTAMARGKPAVDAARSWAAPQLEQSAHAITDTIAPMISEALLNAAHKIDVPKQKQRYNRGFVAGAMVLTAAAGAATFAAVRMRRQSDTMPDSNGSMMVSESVTVESEPPDADLNGGSRVV